MAGSCRNVAHCGGVHAGTHWTEAHAELFPGGGSQLEEGHTVKTHLVPQLAIFCISVVSSIASLRALKCRCFDGRFEIDSSEDDGVVKKSRP